MKEDETAESENSGESIWAVLDSDGNVIKKGFESEEVAEIWTTSEDGKKAVEKAGGTFSVEELTDEDRNVEEEDEG